MASHSEQGLGSDRGTQRAVTGRGGSDGFLIEIAALVAILVGGAAFRYWLSTALPFDAAEFELLSVASHRDHAMRVPFMMLNGASLFALYLVVRRSAGREAALAGLLLLQTSVGFQEQALRIRWLSAPILVSMVVLAYWRLMQPGRQAPGAVARGLVVLALLLGARGLYLGATLPTRMEAIRSASTSDPEILFASLVACGGGVVTPVEQLATCELSWPEQRSLEQQEALLEHAQRLGAVSIRLAGDIPASAPGDRMLAVFDPAGVALLAVPDGPRAATAERLVRVEGAAFFEGR